MDLSPVTMSPDSAVDGSDGAVARCLRPVLQRVRFEQRLLQIPLVALKGFPGGGLVVVMAASLGQRGGEVKPGGSHRLVEEGHAAVEYRSVAAKWLG